MFSWAQLRASPADRPQSEQIWCNNNQTKAKANCLDGDSDLTNITISDADVDSFSLTGLIFS